MPDFLSADVRAISATISGTYAPDLDPEAHMWRRVMKVVGEAGEVDEALRGLVGENPRKGQTHTLDDLRRELLDVALSALGAVSHLNGDGGPPVLDLLTEHTSRVKARLLAAIEARTVDALYRCILCNYETTTPPSRHTVPPGFVRHYRPSDGPGPEQVLCGGQVSEVKRFDVPLPRREPGDFFDMTLPCWCREPHTHGGTDAPECTSCSRPSGCPRHTFGTLTDVQREHLDRVMCEG